MKPAPTRYRAVLFDLFGTVVNFTAPPPAERVAGTFEWLREPLARWHPELPVEDLAAALTEVSRAIAQGRHPEYLEVPSSERFRRALARCGADHDPAAAAALSRAHMAYIAAHTETPAAHVELLRELSGEYALGLVSNFDHGPTAASILDRDGVGRFFEVTLISVDFGRRKPHPSIFAAALRRLGTPNGAALFVGDSAAEDVAGALAAGIDTAWLNPRAQPAPEPAPTYTLRQLTDLRAVLAALV